MFLGNRRFLFHNYSNMNKIVEENHDEGCLWLGDYTAAIDKRMLKEKGIKTVLTTASGLGVSYLPSDGITHKQYNLLDIETQNISNCFDSTYREIEEGLKRGGVLVHCAAGISRSATCVIAYLMRKNNTSLRETMNYVRSKRKVICPNFGFERQLKQFEHHLGISNPAMKITSNNQNILQSQNSNRSASLNKIAFQNLSNNLNTLMNPKLSAEQEDPINQQPPPALLINYNQKVNLQSQSQKNTLKRNQRLQPMTNKNMAQILAQKLAQNNENLQVLGIHKLINNNQPVINKQEKESNNNSNQNSTNKQQALKEAAQLSLIQQQYPQNLMNNGPNIVTYNAKSNLRTSSRGPIPIFNNVQIINNKTNNMITQNQFRKRPVKNLYQ
ncbi:hypothetical protein ABPG72_022749 [Tetrahymena utriculariae]